MDIATRTNGTHEVQKLKSETRDERGRFVSGVYYGVGFKKGQKAWNKGVLQKEVTYSGIHKWISRNFGKASECKYSYCIYPRKNSNGHVLKKPKGFTWANISGEYQRDIRDYIQLCYSCHAKFDRNLIEL